MAPLETKYVIWGLCLTYSWLALPGMAILTQFTLLWDLQPVGGINFGGSMLTAPSQKNNDTEEMARSKLTIPPVETDGSENDFRMDFNYFGPEDRLSKDEMQSSILFVLMQAAPYGSTTSITGSWRPRVQDDDCLFVAENMATGSTPTFNFSWLVRATAAAANFLIERQVFRGLSGTIVVAGRAVGKVTFYPAPMGDSVALPTVGDS
ncbi:MAG: hypothetical protein Q9218_007427 [Villophora microphyllina]